MGNLFDGAIAEQQNRQQSLYSSGSPHFNPNSDTYAQDTRAWITRDQYRDYQTRFEPVEDQLIDAVTGEKMLDESLSAIRINNKQSFDASALSAQQTKSMYGMQETPNQTASQDANRSLAMAKSTANGTNQTRAHIESRDDNAIGGSGARQAIGGG